MASVHLKGYIRQEVLNSVRGILFRHVIIVRNSFPYALDEEFYTKVLGEELIQELAIVHMYPQKFLSTANKICITLPDAISHKAYLMKMQDTFILPPIPTSWGFSPKESAFAITRHTHPDIAPAMEEWVVKYSEAQQAIGNANTIVTEVVDSCRTAGQLRKACPELIKFLSDETQQKLGGTIARKMPRVDTENLAKMPAIVSIIAAGVLLPPKSPDDLEVSIFNF